MARNFNANQVRHIFVADKYDEKAADEKSIGLKVVGKDKSEVYLVYHGSDGIIKSPLIPVKNIEYVKAIAAADLRRPFKSQKVALVNDPVSGQDYILRIVLSQWIGMSDEDQYFKDVAVHAGSGMTKAQFYTELVKQLNLSFSREIGASKDSNPYLSFTAASDGVVITEKKQGYTRGLEQQLPVLFDAQPSTIYVDGADTVWGTVTDVTPKKSAVTVDGDSATGVGNGADIADLEYFALGERGDQYRMVGWPNVIPTTYYVDPSKEYNVLELHFAFTDTGINSYKSDKDITVVSTDAAVINSIVSALNTATGLSIASLATASSAKQNTLAGSED